MYNRFTHQKQTKILQNQLSRMDSHDKLHKNKQKSNQEMANRYKERVRDFLVQVTSKPLVLGQYQPPIKNIVRNPENQKILSNPQLYISGFKTNRQRIQYAVENNKILDLNPTNGTALLHQFKSRNTSLQIQPGMRFQGKNKNQKLNESKSLTNLPSIQSNPSRLTKIRYKAIEQIGNNLKTMRQKQEDEIGLINRLQTVSGGKQFDHLTFSMMALRQSKMLRSKFSPGKGTHSSLLKMTVK